MKIIDGLEGSRALITVTIISGLWKIVCRWCLVNFTRYFGVSLLPVVLYREVEGDMIFKISYTLIQVAYIITLTLLRHGCDTVTSC